jgi:hypothetical protein
MQLDERIARASHSSGSVREKLEVIDPLNLVSDMILMSMHAHPPNHQGLIRNTEGDRAGG